MKKSSFQRYMNAQSVFLRKRAKRENISVIDAIEKYGEYFRTEYTKRIHKVERLDAKEL